MIADADGGRAGTLAARLAEQGFPAEAVPIADLQAALRGASGLVHATPIGMAKFPGMPVDPAWLHAGLWVAEIVYVPLDTALLRAARAAGCVTIDGGGMAVLQAARAMEIFTGLRPDIDRMRAHFATLVAR